MPQVMLSKMLELVSTAHCRHDPNTRAGVLHPLRVMANMKTNDEELNCIALGHELLNKTTMPLRNIVEVGMSDRVIEGLLLLKEAPTLDETLDNICSSYDSARVGLACLLDRGALLGNVGCNKEKQRAGEELHRAYMRIARELNTIERNAALKWSTQSIAKQLLWS